MMVRRVKKIKLKEGEFIIFKDEIPPRLFLIKTKNGQVSAKYLKDGDIVMDWKGAMFIWHEMPPYELIATSQHDKRFKQEEEEPEQPPTPNDIAFQ